MILKESWVFSDRFINVSSDLVLLLHVKQRMAAIFRGTIHLNQFYLTLSLSAMHAKYTPGSQQCRSTLQLRTSCSLPTYFKPLCLLNHSSNLIHPYINLKTLYVSVGGKCVCVCVYTYTYMCEGVCVGVCVCVCIITGVGG